LIEALYQEFHPSPHLVTIARISAALRICQLFHGLVGQWGEDHQVAKLGIWRHDVYIYIYIIVLFYTILFNVTLFYELLFFYILY
jgi:hypothetical protein